MLKASSYWAGYLVPLSLSLGYLFHGMWFWAPVFVSFVCLPLADHWVGREFANPTPEQEENLRGMSSFDCPLYFYIVVQLTLVVLGSLWFATKELQVYERIGLVIATGVATGGLGITIAHELCHRTNKWARASGFFILSLVNYSHFGIEHVAGHHFRVATPLDPASARFGESTYRFVIRSIFGSIVSVVEIEKKRLSKKNLKPWSLRNRMIWCAIAPLIIGTIIFFFTGLLGLFFFVAQSFVAIFLLEVTNFVEHYGLQRRLRANGKYERVTPLHSWNANQKISNLFLFKLQRHADHHANATRPYQILRHFEESPQLPYGYPTMILIALLPVLWRRIMNPRVEQIRMAQSPIESE